MSEAALNFSELPIKLQTLDSIPLEEIAAGRVKQHVMPNFPKTPYETFERVYEGWHFYNTYAPLSAVGTFVTKFPDYKALDFSELPIKFDTLDSIPLEEIAAVFQEKLAHNFHSVSSEVIECPDLTKEPYNLAAKGLGGNPVLIDLNYVPNLLLTVNRKRYYDLSTITKLVGDDKCFIIGAGSGFWPHNGENCEGIFNVVVSENEIVKPGTRIAYVDKNEECKVEIVPANEKRCCLIANVFSSRGETGKVVKVHCKKRIGELDFVTSMQSALEEAFPNKFIGMGGVFVVCQGRVKQHVLPNFPKTPYEAIKQLREGWYFYNMSVPLSAVGTFVTKFIPGLYLTSHFHSFGKTEGGHIYGDTTPDDVEYLAILATGRTLARIDRTKNSGSSFGKD